jgi:hypothetical protein
MTYSNNLKETVQDSWAEIYSFVTPNATWRYTSYHQQVIFALETYSPVAMKRNGWVNTTKAEPAQLKITLSLMPEIQNMLTNSVIPQCDLTITRFFVADPLKNAVVFRGQLLSFVIVRDGSELTFQSSGYLYSTKIPSFIYQATCNHMLFDGKCGIDQSLWADNYIDAAFDGTKITHAGIGSKPTNHYSHGLVEYNGQKRMVTKSLGNDVFINVPFFNAGATGDVRIWAGCDQKAETCQAKFNNLENFLGFPYIPIKNPTIYGV